MSQKNLFAFCGSALQREAHLREDPLRIAALAKTGALILFWHGQPLFDAASGRLALLEPQATLAAQAGPATFLGSADGRTYFAAQLCPSSVAAQRLEADPDTEIGAPHGAVFRDLRRCLNALNPLDAELAATAKALLHWQANSGFCPSCGAEAQLSAAGWRRDCPSCAAQHFPRSDPVVIMLVTRGNRALLGRNHGWPEGMYSCLAGFIEPGETAEAAVCREVLEEVGVRLKSPRYIASQPWPYPANIMLGFHAQAADETIMLDAHELEDALWVTREDMVSILDETHPHINGARRGSIAHYLVQSWVNGQIV